MDFKCVPIVNSREESYFEENQIIIESYEAMAWNHNVNSYVLNWLEFHSQIGIAQGDEDKLTATLVNMKWKEIAYVKTGSLSDLNFIFSN